MAKEGNPERLELFIRLLVEVIRTVAKEIYPFMPITSESILKQLGNELIEKGNPLFPRIDTKKIK